MIQTEEHPAPAPRAAASGGYAVEGIGLVKRFGRVAALDGLDIRVPRGSVYALLGRNGVGKTTLVQLLTGFLEASEGTISVLDLNPQKDSVALKRRLGYIPDRLPMYDWMTVDQLLKFTADFYDNWSADEENGLVQRFRIDRSQKVGTLSKGYRALLALVLAMSHQPDLVLLDECTSGMDAIARREFERSVIDALQQSGRTVLFAGHQIDEMERICDWVGIMKSGRMLVEAPIDELEASFKLLRLSAESGGPESIPDCSVLGCRTVGRELHLTVRLERPGEKVGAMPGGVKLLEEAPLSLEDIFVSLVGEDAKEQEDRR